MARPLSEEKREAILAAATELVARLGTSASTAKIADAAGLGEGTLFTYFPTKDDLLNQLLLEIETSLAEALFASSKRSGTPRQRVQRIWDCLIEWGAEHPLQRKAMRQLRVSDRISAENRQRCHALFRDARETIEQSLSGRVDPERASFYIDTVMMGLADIAIEAIAAAPKQHEHFKQAGFDLFWKGVAA
ncbi:TetR/AcrR family transcriptional regulator [Bradyrhizobium xenonodulans]|uniref:TetR/AcrR family transcriptional regulator n=1 Tax=Bradyrhizobium xenonodulans TaxID=2736875 RepID=A0ABY7MSZ8_9BRAD|nr:TetR/AcrR family transcriptional regulator [Bradyrhizobium xenonodulans]WBL81076.1 TetR/AcrR family transcriptional regulator [Bradyrhizobium xenonodulans]